MFCQRSFRQRFFDFFGLGSASSGGVFVSGTSDKFIDSDNFSNASLASSLSLIALALH